jgi:hypothetical protein
LRVSVCTNELNSINLIIDHVMDCVSATTTYTDNFDLGALREIFD